MRIQYRSNNSGGIWWLETEDWKALEKAGWTVSWHKMLGSEAQEAEKDFSSFFDAIKEFEQVTGENAADEGCECCGPPHAFYEV